LRGCGRLSFPGNCPAQAGNWRNSGLSGTWHGSCSEARDRGFPVQRSKMMEKFEALAFAVGFIATGFLTLVALPLA
jgi:hypothetical protein